MTQTQKNNVILFPVERAKERRRESLDRTVDGEVSLKLLEIVRARIGEKFRLTREGGNQEYPLKRQETSAQLGGYPESLTEIEGNRTNLVHRLAGTVLPRLAGQYVVAEACGAYVRAEELKLKFGHALRVFLSNTNMRKEEDIVLVDRVKEGLNGNYPDLSSFIDGIFSNHSKNYLRFL